MIATGLVLVSSLVFSEQTAPPSAPAPQASACAQAVRWGTEPVVGALCAGDEAERLASTLPKDSADRMRQLDAAAQHYRRATTLGNRVDAHVLALGLLARSYDTNHLNDVAQRETALRDLIHLSPGEVEPVGMLASLQEERGLLDAAEATLLDARRQRPEAVEPYQLLAQFYARRVTALKGEQQQKRPSPRAVPVRLTNGASIASAVR